jgi:hypothetical protein
MLSLETNMINQLDVLSSSQSTLSQYYSAISLPFSSPIQSQMFSTFVHTLQSLTQHNTSMIFRLGDARREGRWLYKVETKYV